MVADGLYRDGRQISPGQELVTSRVRRGIDGRGNSVAECASPDGMWCWIDDVVGLMDERSKSLMVVEVRRRG
jgi:hypothetical protein